MYNTHTAILLDITMGFDSGAATALVAEGLNSMLSIIVLMTFLW